MRPKVQGYVFIHIDMSDQCSVHSALLALPLEVRVLSFHSPAACAQQIRGKFVLLRSIPWDVQKRCFVLLFAAILVISGFDEHHFPSLGLSSAAPAHKIELRGTLQGIPIHHFDSQLLRLRKKSSFLERFREFISTTSTLNYCACAQNRASRNASAHDMRWTPIVRPCF